MSASQQKTQHSHTPIQPAPPNASEARRVEASVLAERFIQAKTPSDIADAICEIESFVCHLAREVEEGDVQQNELTHYADSFGDLLVGSKEVTLI